MDVMKDQNNHWDTILLLISVLIHKAHSSANIILSIEMKVKTETQTQAETQRFLSPLIQGNNLIVREEATR